MDVRRILVTGADGFVARHLVPALRADGDDVLGTALRPDAARALSIPVRALDMTRGEQVKSLLRHTQPTHVVHLAAVSSVKESFADPRAATDVNVAGTQALLEGAAALPLPPLTLIIGSGEEYGPNDGLPLRECPLTGLHPVSPYGKSKKDVEELIEATPEFRRFVIRTRSFPHIGPQQGGQFFLPEAATQIVRIERGDQPPVIGAGNVSAVRDFTDVRDVVQAYLLLLQKGVRGEVYNVCSGTAVKIRDLLNQLLKFSTIDIRIEQDPAKVRPVDIPVLVGDGSKLRAATGWTPRIPLAQTLKDVLEYQRGRPTSTA